MKFLVTQFESFYTLKNLFYVKTQIVPCEGKLETCLNGKSPWFIKYKDNSVSNQIKSLFLLFFSYFGVEEKSQLYVHKNANINSTKEQIDSNQSVDQIDSDQIDSDLIDSDLIDTVLIDSNQSVDQLNSMPRIRSRKKPGLYMIRCKKNDKRYYGETKNVQGRLASHKSYLTRNIHPNALMQHDWNTYGQENFEFTTLFMGVEWDNYQSRIDKETLLIVQDGKLCYNYLIGRGPQAPTWGLGPPRNKKPGEKNPFYGKQHSEETKNKIGLAMKGIPNDLLGRSIKLLGEVYASIAEASRQTGMARKTIRKRLNDVNDPSCIEIDNNK